MLSASVTDFVALHRGLAVKKKKLAFKSSSCCICLTVSLSGVSAVKHAEGLLGGVLERDLDEEIVVQYILLQRYCYSKYFSHCEFLSCIQIYYLFIYSFSFFMFLLGGILETQFCISFPTHSYTQSFSYILRFQC